VAFSICRGFLPGLSLFATYEPYSAGRAFRFLSQCSYPSRASTRTVSRGVPQSSANERLRSIGAARSMKNGLISVVGCPFHTGASPADPRVRIELPAKNARSCSPVSAIIFGVRGFNSPTALAAWVMIYPYPDLLTRDGIGSVGGGLVLHPGASLPNIRRAAHSARGSTPGR